MNPIAEPTIEQLEAYAYRLIAGIRNNEFELRNVEAKINELKNAEALKTK